MFLGNRICAGIFISVVCLCAGCDAVYKYLDKEGAEEKELIGEALPLERNPKIEEIQILLNLYGYGSGIPDGVLGFKTRQAIEQFQKDNDLKVTRFVDLATWQKLNLFRQNQLIVNNRLNVRLMQKILKVNGYYTGNADGKVGPKTLQAVKDFQKKHHLKPDGRVGFKTLMALSTYLKVEALPAYPPSSQDPQ